MDALEVASGGVMVFGKCRHHACRHGADRPRERCKLTAVRNCSFLRKCKSTEILARFKKYPNTKLARPGQAAPGARGSQFESG